jgi:membrane-bound ClpP family serine protease
MNEWLIVISLIVFGLILVVAEVIFVPGTTLVGLLGMICVILGIYQAFEHFSNPVAYGVLGGTSVLFTVILYYVFTTKVWEKFALNGQIKSKFNEGVTDILHVGDIGMTTSSLKPIGNAEFSNKVYEVKSQGEYVDANNQVEIVKIDRNQIIIKSIN